MKLTWDEPEGCTSPRGWLQRDGMPIAFYLDYGPDHYRSPHSSTVGTMYGRREVQWCQPGRECPSCQPGNILCVRYPAGPRDSNTGRASRYVETIAQARTYCETGTLTPAETIPRAA
jgi:hypothetical protein